MIKLLLVEDSDQWAGLLKDELEALENYQVSVAYNGNEGLKMWKELSPDIIVTGVDMPMMNGFKMVEQIRQTDTATPVVFATWYTDSKHVEEGYSLGCNAYIKKYYSYKELDGQIQSIFRMMNGCRFKPENSTYVLGIYRFNPKEFTLVNTRTHYEVYLGRYTSAVLEILARNHDEMVKRETIIQEVWDSYYSENNLTNCIYKLRKYLKDDRNICILMYRGLGYELSITDRMFH